MDDNIINNNVDSVETSPDEKLPTPVESEKESKSSPVSVQPNRSPEITFQGNSYDLMSVVGVSIGGMTLFTISVNLRI